MENETELKLSELLSKEKYDVYQAFLANSSYPIGIKFRDLIRAVAESAYNRGLADQNGVPIKSEEEKASVEAATDISLKTATNDLIQQAIAHAEENGANGEELPA